jgi:copper homeostasis protein
VADIVAVRALPRPPTVTVGFVIGALTRNGAIDVPVTTRLLRACAGVPVTFHRAFDVVTDQGSALEVLIDLGLDRVLTSGGQPTAVAGIDSLAELVERADERISVLAAGGIRARNVAEIVRRTGVREVHLRANPAADSASTSAMVVQAVRAALE